MRIVLATVSALVLTFGAFALASGDDAAPGGTAKDAVTTKAFQALRARVDALQAEVRYLRSREAAVSAYVLKNEQRGRGLEIVVGRVRSAGFEARTIPVDSRKLLLDGLVGAAQSIRKGLPAVSPTEARMLEEIAKLRRAAGMGG